MSIMTFGGGIKYSNFLHNQKTLPIFVITKRNNNQHSQKMINLHIIQTGALKRLDNTDSLTSEEIDDLYIGHIKDICKESNILYQDYQKADDAEKEEMENDFEMWGRVTLPTTN